MAGRRLLVAVVALLAAARGSPAQERANWQFTFGPGPAGPGAARVAPDATYSRERGFGFEPGAKVRPAGPIGLTADGPFFFSAAVPEGNYRVTVTLGGHDGGSVTTVKAELRRLMLERVAVPAG